MSWGEEPTLKIGNELGRGASCLRLRRDPTIVQRCFEKGVQIGDYTYAGPHLPRALNSGEGMGWGLEAEASTLPFKPLLPPRWW